MITTLVLLVQLLAATPATSPASPVPAPFHLYVPPKGWSEVTPGWDVSRQRWVYEGMYVPPTGDRLFTRFTVLSAKTIGITLDEFVRIHRSELNLANLNALAENRAYGLCNGSAGWILAYDYGDFGRQMHAVEVLTVNKTRAYIAKYERRLKDAQLPEALAALGSLCAPPDVANEDLGEAPPIIPPEGWRAMTLSDPNAAGSETPPIWAWHSPLHDTHASVVLVMMMQTRSAESLTDEALAASLQNGMAKWASNIKLLSRDSLTLCRAGATHYRMSADVYGEPAIIDAVISAGSPASYASVYIRRANDVEEPDAERSIRSLCPRGITVSRRGPVSA